MDTVHERIDSLDDEAKVLIKFAHVMDLISSREFTKVAPQFLSSKDESHLQNTWKHWLHAAWL